MASQFDWLFASPTFPQQADLPIPGQRAPIFPVPRNPARAPEGLEQFISDATINPLWDVAKGVGAAASGYGNVPEVGEGLLAAMGLMTPGMKAKLAYKALSRSGIPVERPNPSGLSKSNYLEPTIPDWRGYDIGPLPEDATRTIKMRFSDHDLPPTYEVMNGPANIEVGPHQASISDSIWPAIKWVINQAGINPDRTTRGMITRFENKQAQAEAERLAAKQRLETETAPRIEAAKRSWEDLKREMGAPADLQMPAGVWNPNTQRRWLAGMKERGWKY